MKFPTLYKLTSTGKTQLWEIEVKGSTIIERWGQVDGKIQSTEDTITVGKNIGKSNETSPKEQAEAEAKSKWEKKLSGRGYVENLKRAEKGENDFEGGISPMLAHKFSEYEHKIVYPAYAQSKLDGHRMMMDLDGNLWSREHKPINSCLHIKTAAKEVECIDIPLDGEGYRHDYHDNFEHITHLLKQPNYIPECNIIQYHVYDAPIPGTFEERNQTLVRALKNVTHPLILVKTIKVKNKAELMTAYEDFLEEGYEGAMVRNAAGLYVHKRSYDLLKMKLFEDGEFKIVGADEGRGKMKGKLATFTCVTKEGNEFNVSYNKPLPELQKLWENPKLWKNKELTVKFQGYTRKNHVPRIPKGLRFREDL